VVSSYRAIAAAFEALAGWLDDGTGAGRPTKWLVAQAVIAIREIAATARAEAKVSHFPPPPCPRCGHPHTGMECADCPEGYCESRQSGEGPGPDDGAEDETFPDLGERGPGGWLP
jgi:hypothetical protein